MNNLNNLGFHIHRKYSKNFIIYILHFRFWNKDIPAFPASIELYIKVFTHVLYKNISADFIPKTNGLAVYRYNLIACLNSVFLRYRMISLGLFMLPLVFLLTLVSAAQPGACPPSPMLPGSSMPRRRHIWTWQWTYPVGVGKRR